MEVDFSGISMHSILQWNCYEIKSGDLLLPSFSIKHSAKDLMNPFFVRFVFCTKVSFTSQSLQRWRDLVHTHYTRLQRARCYLHIRIQDNVTRSVGLLLKVERLLPVKFFWCSKPHVIPVQNLPGKWTSTY